MHEWSKHVKIRAEAWLDRLRRENYNSLEQQNRVNYLKLLHLMLECQHLVAPFHACPSSQTLPLLDKQTYQSICEDIASSKRKVGSTRLSSLFGSPCASPRSRNRTIKREPSYGSTMTRGKSSCHDLGQK